MTVRPLWDHGWPLSRGWRRGGRGTVAGMTVPSIELRGGVAIPQLGLGVWQVPADSTADVVGHALRAGYRHIDTAAAYRNERGVGEAVAASGLSRDELFITTKVWNGEHGRERAKAAARKSLERLGLDHVDLLLIHWPVPSRDLYVETWQALIDLRDEGATRAIGVSNFQPDHLRRIIDETGETPAVNQIELHPGLQQHALRESHAALGIVTESWSPLGQGGALKDPVVGAIAERLGRTPGQVIIRWHLEHGFVLFPNSVNPARIDENFDVFGFDLSADDMASIDALDAGHRIGPDPDTFALT